VATLLPAVVGDINLVRSRILASELDTLEDGTEPDSAAVVVAHIWRGTTEPEELEVAVTDAEGCVIAVEFGDEYGWLATAATAGVWLIEYEVTYDDGTVLTVPAQWPDEIYIRDEHDPE
jgi:hypothetical protein